MCRLPVRCLHKLYAFWGDARLARSFSSNLPIRRLLPVAHAAVVGLSWPTQAQNLVPVSEPYRVECNHNSVPGTFQFSGTGTFVLSPTDQPEMMAHGEVELTVYPPGNDATPINLGTFTVVGTYKQFAPGRLGAKAVDFFTLKPTEPDTSELALAKLLVNYPEPGKTASSVRLANGQTYRAGCFAAQGQRDGV